MEFGKEILYLFVNFLATPALLMGIFGMIGSIVQRKKTTEVFICTLKTMMGYMILSGGAALLVSSLNGFDIAFQKLFGVVPVIPNNDGIGGLVQSSLGLVGTLSSVVMIISMIGNIILARFTNLKYIYLSGHVLFYISICVVVTSVMVGLDPSKDAWIIIVTGSAIVSMYMAISPAICQKFMREITSSDDIAMGHTSALNYCISGYIGLGISKLTKKQIKKCDQIKISDKFAFLRNRSLLIVITMTIIYSMVFISAWAVLGKTWFVQNSIVKNNDSIVVMIIIKTITFAAGMEVILYGVRTILNELIPAFKGISDKIVKGARPALDCPVVYPYSQNAVFIGFFGSLIGGILMFAISILISKYTNFSSVIIPGTISIFFTGAAAGVFGDSKGGVWGALIGGFVNGFLVTLIPYIFVLLNLLPPEILAISATWGDVDFVIGLFIGMWKIFGVGMNVKWILLASSLIVWFFLLVTGILIQMKRNKKIKLNKINNEINNEINNGINNTKIENEFKEEIKNE